MRPYLDNFRDNINRPCKGFGDGDLTDVTMFEYIGDGKGCVLTVNRAISSSGADADKGFFTQSSFPHIDDFSGSGDYHYMAEDQLSKMKINRALKGEGEECNPNTFFVLYWEMTIEGIDVPMPMSVHAALTQSSLF